MLDTLISMYITLMAPVIGGVLVMIWCKIHICDFLKKPIDGGKNLKDGERIFGDNKTFKGFIGYIVFNMVSNIAWGYLCSLSEYMTSHNFMYANHDNTILFNMGVGALIGFAYALFELPNSFIKRRLHIVPGKTIEGFKKIFFVFLDQADSVFGCVLVICFVHPMSIWMYFLYVLIGAATHILINVLLYVAHLRKNPF